MVVQNKELWGPTRPRAFYFLRRPREADTQQNASVSVVCVPHCTRRTRHRHLLLCLSLSRLPLRSPISGISRCSARKGRPLCTLMYTARLPFLARLALYGFSTTFYGGREKLIRSKMRWYRHSLTGANWFCMIIRGV